MTAIDLGASMAIDVNMAIRWGIAVVINLDASNWRYLGVLLVNELDVAMIINMDVAMSTSLNVAIVGDANTAVARDLDSIMARDFDMTMAREFRCDLGFEWSPDYQRPVYWKVPIRRGDLM